MVQVTPLLLESFATVAVKATVCPWSIDVWVEGDMETAMAGAVGVWLVEPPQPNKNNMPDNIKPNLLITRLPPGVSKGRFLSAISLRQREAEEKCLSSF
jgi:hypothetical protein